MRQVGKDLAAKIDAAYADERGSGWFDIPAAKEPQGGRVSELAKPSTHASAVTQNLESALLTLAKAIEGADGLAKGQVRLLLACLGDGEYDAADVVARILAAFEPSQSALNRVRKSGGT